MKVKSESEVAQSCPTLSHPMDCSLPGSFVHGIFQARVLEWGAIAFSKGQSKTTKSLDPQIKKIFQFICVLVQFLSSVSHSFVCLSLSWLNLLLVIYYFDAIIMLF